MIGRISPFDGAERSCQFVQMVKAHVTAWGSLLPLGSLNTERTWRV